MRKGNNMKWAVSLITGFLLISAPALQAQEMISPKNAIDIAEAIRDLGYRAKLEKDSVGDPMISSNAAGLNYAVFFYSCNDGSGCQSIQLSASFTLNESSDKPDLNEWNRINRYVKAHWAEDGDIVVKFDINMWGPGISTDAFVESLNVWERQLDDFKKHIDW